MMDWGLCISAFYRRVSTDQRIGPVHISLYFSLLHEAGHTLTLPFYLKRGRIMLKAKISSPVTLNTCLHCLHNYGYIDYRPSFAPGQSMVCLLPLV